MVDFIVSFLLLFILGGAAWRARGQDWKLTTQINRFGIWGIAVAVLCLWYSHSLSFCVAAIFAGGVGCIPGYHGDIDFSKPESRTQANMEWLTASGVFRMVPLMLIAFYWGYELNILFSVIAGVMFVPAYVAGYWIAQRVTLPYLTCATEWGEFLFGGFLFSALGMGLHSL